MKKLLVVILFASFPFIINAQVQARPLPKSGYEKRIRDYVDNMKVIDTHEHLYNPDKIKEWTSTDFILLLSHYAIDDIKSAGISDQAFNMLMKDSLSVMEKWKILKPYWEGAKNTAYCRVALLAADKLYGISDINESTVVPLSEKIKKAYQTNWFYDMIEKCNIEFLIQNGSDWTFGNERFKYVDRFDNFIRVNSKQNIKTIADQQNLPISSLDEFVKALEKAFKTAKEREFVGIKSTLAYSRIINFENVKKEKAEEAFLAIMNAKDGNVLSFAEVKPLQDYIMHRVINFARDNNLPMVIHTGLQAGNSNIIENSKPTHLVNLFMEYPDVNFVLFHGSYPYGGELAAIAKNFRNVYIDLCWLYIISPSYSERFLHEWLETIPANKIMAFGGDYRNVENIYGHLMFAKQIVSNVLIDKVKDGYMTELEAKNVAQMILHDNAVKFYKLDTK